MELYSFDQRELEKDYNYLLELYLNETNQDKKIKLYSQIIPLRTYLKSSKITICTAPKGYLAKINESREKIKKSYIENSNLTEELCYYWCRILREMSSANRSTMSQKFSNKGEYFKEMKSFFEEKIPDDVPLLLDTFTNNHILVKRSLLCSREEMLYSDVLEKYYVKILYYLNLSHATTRNTIHELGHVSECKASFSNDSYDYIMEEVIPTLYELLYIDFYSHGDKNIMLSEFYYLFKIVNLSPLENCMISNINEKNISYEDFFLGEIRSMYSNIIALSLYLRTKDNNFFNKIEYIKKNKPYVPAFELLASVGITEEELIYTAKNAKKLIKSE